MTMSQNVKWSFECEVGNENPLRFMQEPTEKIVAIVCCNSASVTAPWFATYIIHLILSTTFNT